MKHSTIFIAMPSFRDPECANTVLQIFTNAKYPDRLRMGIFEQVCYFIYKNNEIKIIVILKIN